MLTILVGEATVGYPVKWPHPVMAVGALIDGIERRWNHGVARRAKGVALLLVLIVTAGGVGWAIEHVAGGSLGFALAVIAGSTGLAQRSLNDHVVAVAEPLAAGDLPGARHGVARIVGRDTDRLAEAGVATAAIESLAESFCDGVVMPAFWYALLGLPGLFAAKAISTADSLVGHRTERLEAFGWASARADDLIAFVPARLSGALIALAGRGGWRIMVRDARRHASPNAGWPEAAMAGALGRRLGGSVTYDGEPAPRPVIGEGPPPAAADLYRALTVYRRACLLLWLIAGAFAWGR
nr:adenosylcobinamide-phosphate synthase CbiB [Sphingomonas chungangi]